MRPAVFSPPGVCAGWRLSSAGPRAQLSETGGPVSHSAETSSISTANAASCWSAMSISSRTTRVCAPIASPSISANPVGNRRRASQGLGPATSSAWSPRRGLLSIRPSQSARGNRAIYETAQDSVTFSGNVMVASDENVIRGETLVCRSARGGRRSDRRLASGCAACSSQQHRATPGGDR